MHEPKGFRPRTSVDPTLVIGACTNPDHKGQTVWACWHHEYQAWVCCGNYPTIPLCGHACIVHERDALKARAHDAQQAQGTSGDSENRAKD